MNFPIVGTRWSPSSLPSSDVPRRSLTHSVVGLGCALPNDELCIGRCHFEKCNYLRDKADGSVLSGICCASIKRLELEAEALVHKRAHVCARLWMYERTHGSANGEFRLQKTGELQQISKTTWNPNEL